MKSLGIASKAKSAATGTWRAIARLPTARPGSPAMNPALFRLRRGWRDKGRPERERLNHQTAPPFSLFFRGFRVVPGTPGCALNFVAASIGGARSEGHDWANHNQPLLKENFEHQPKVIALMDYNLTGNEMV